MKKKSSAIQNTASSSLKNELFRKNLGNLAGSILGLLLDLALTLFLSVLLQLIVDSMLDGGSALPFGTLLWLTAALLGLLLLYGGVWGFFRPRFQARAMGQYKEAAFSRLLQKSIAAFSREGTATYLSALSNDAAIIEEKYVRGLTLLFSYILYGVGMLATMLLYSPLLTAAAIVFSLLPLAAAFATGARMAPAEKTVSDKNAGYMETLRDALAGFSIIKSFKAEKQILRQYEISSREAEAAKARRMRLSILIYCISSMASITAQLGVFIFGAWLAHTGNAVTPGVVIAFGNLMGQMMSTITDFPETLSNLRAARGLMRKLDTALSANLRDEGTDIPKVLNSGITLRQVTFGYEADTPVLQNIDAAFASGKSYALVGASGSGKSTLLNLLMGASSDYTGDILYDGRELRTVSTASLYELVSQVQQNVFLFNSSIRSNITMFREFPQEEVERAIELSGLRPLLEQRGEDYHCGENGCGLSGGEKQRISIARCLLRHSPVLLMDEGTAALDAETARTVTESILDLKGMTRILVTHNMDGGMLRRCDSILCLKNGRIAEQGDFETLMARKGYFYSLFTVNQ